MCVCVCVKWIFICVAHSGEITDGDDVLHEQSVVESFFYGYFFLFYLARIICAFYTIRLSLVRRLCRVCTRLFLDIFPMLCVYNVYSI